MLLNSNCTKKIRVPFENLGIKINRLLTENGAPVRVKLRYLSQTFKDEL